MKERGKKSTKAFYYFVLASFLLPVGFLVIRLIAVDPGDVKTRADYSLMLVQCLLGAVVIHLPAFLSKQFHLEIPEFLFIMYLIFLYAAIFLGEVRNFYYVVPHWDDILHCFSSMMTGTFAFMLVATLNHDKHVAWTLTPIFVALFAFSFSVMIGAVWEIYEFTFDSILGLNMQKFRLADGTQLIGQNALRDTMKDIIVDCIGAFVSSTVGFLAIKKKNGIAYLIIGKEDKGELLDNYEA